MSAPASLGFVCTYELLAAPKRYGQRTLAGGAAEAPSFTFHFTATNDVGSSRSSTWLDSKSSQRARSLGGGAHTLPFTTRHSACARSSSVAGRQRDGSNRPMSRACSV